MQCSVVRQDQFGYWLFHHMVRLPTTFYELLLMMFCWHSTLHSRDIPLRTYSEDVSGPCGVLCGSPGCVSGCQCYVSLTKYLLATIRDCKVKRGPRQEWIFSTYINPRRQGIWSSISAWMKYAAKHSQTRSARSWTSNMSMKASLRIYQTYIVEVVAEK